MRKILLLIFCVVSLSSCRVLVQNFMLRTDKDFQFDEIPEVKDLEYKLAPNDIISISMYTNEGSALVNINNRSNANLGTALSFKVEFDGFVNLPILGRKYVAGLTSRQLEAYLEDLYSDFFIDPFIIVNVTNRRVYIFSEGKASVISLENDNTTIFEVLARAGGIPTNGKAHFIKLIRGDLKDPQVFLIDLSELNTIYNADIVLQSQDIIYIETRREYASRTLALIAPYFSVLSTLLLIYTLIRTNPFN